MTRSIYAMIVSIGMLAAAENGKYEVWSIDHSNSPGRVFGGTVRSRSRE
jgi:hypothetical protein